MAQLMAGISGRLGQARILAGTTLVSPIYFIFHVRYKRRKEFFNNIYKKIVFFFWQFQLLFCAIFVATWLLTVN